MGSAHHHASFAPQHMACRDTANPGTVTTIHFTDLGVEGTVPLEELCAFDNLWVSC